MSTTQIRWCVEDENTGMPVANGSAAKAEDAHREVMHYAVQYAQDGPVRFWVRENRKTIMKGRLGGISITRTPSI